MSDESASALVVLPVLNEAQYIESVLSQLALHLPADLAVRLLVVDGGSADDTVKIATRLGKADSRILVLHNPKRLQSSSVNLAVRTFGADFKVLIRCDAHSIYPPTYVSDLIETLNRTQADAVVVPMDTRGDTCLRKAIAWVSTNCVLVTSDCARATSIGGRRPTFNCSWSLCNSNSAALSACS